MMRLEVFRLATEMLQYLDPDGLGETVLNIGQIKTSLEGQISDLGESIEEAMQNLPYARPDGLYPDMTVGAVIGADETAQWATRESTGSGAATVRSVQGATEVQNGELVPVRIAGIRSTGRNLIDLNSPYGSGSYNQDAGYQITAGTPSATPSGENPCVITVHNAWNAVTFVSASLEVGKSYKFALTSVTDALRATIYMLDSNHVVTRRIGNYLGATSITSTPTVAEGEVYFAIYCTSNGATTLTLTNVMLQVATADFDTYEPYRIVDSIEWPTQTLRAAGSVADELTAGELVTRVGVVDLGTLDWFDGSTNVSGVYRMRSREVFTAAKKAESNPIVANVTMMDYPAASSSSQWSNPTKSVAIDSTGYVIVYDPNYNQQGSSASFKAAMSGVLLYYELATPTTTPISPALSMTYKVQAGGSESIIVPDGEVSAAPVLTVAEPVNAGDEFARIWAAIESLGYTRNTAQLSRPVSLTDIGSIDEVQKDTTDVVEIGTIKEVQE